MSDNKEKILFKNLNKQLDNCILNGKRDFEELKKNDPLYVTKFRVGIYIEDMNSIWETYKNILENLNIDLKQDSVDLYIEKMMSLQRWYFLLK